MRSDNTLVQDEPFEWYDLDMDDDLTDIEAQLAAIQDWVETLRARLADKHTPRAVKQLDIAGLALAAARIRVQAVQVARKPS
jgi:DNA-binding FrmR family transcriptional regulator